MQFDKQKSEIGMLYGLISKVRSLLMLKEMIREGWVKATGDYHGFKAQLERVPAAKLQEIAKSHLDVPAGAPKFANSIFAFVMNQARYDALPAELSRLRRCVIAAVGHDQRDHVLTIGQAHAAFLAWRVVPAPKRGAIVMRAAQLLQERRNEIASAVAREEGKLVSEAQGEMNRSINVTEFSAAQGRRLGEAATR